VRPGFNEWSDGCPNCYGCLGCNPLARAVTSRVPAETRLQDLLECEINEDGGPEFVGG
jgi:hypothetical protein